MSIAMAEVVRIDTLDQIIHVYENAEKLYGNKSINETLREYLYTLPILDNCPKGLPNMEDVIADYERGEKYSEEDIILCAARLSDLYSSPWYNRIRELRYGNQKRHLDDNDGFSYEAADTLSGLTAGTNYYVQADGTLASSWDSSDFSSFASNTPLAGLALSSSKLLIRDPLAKT